MTTKSNSPSKKTHKITNPPTAAHYKRSRLKNMDESVDSLKILAKEASSHAIKESRALELPITYLEDGLIYKEEPNGNRIVIGKVEVHI